MGLCNGFGGMKEVPVHPKMARDSYAHFHPRCHVGCGDLDTPTRQKREVSNLSSMYLFWNERHLIAQVILIVAVQKGVSISLAFAEIKLAQPFGTVCCSNIPKIPLRLLAGSIPNRPWNAPLKQCLSVCQIVPVYPDRRASKCYH